MTKFLSQGWADELVEALNGAPDVVDSLNEIVISIQQIVTGTPDGDVNFWTTFDHGLVQGGIGVVPTPDVTFTQDYETATALSRAELNPQAAFMQGKLKITGNMGKLLQHQTAIQALGPAMAGIATEY
jgi:putative sterol carrier protein